MILVVLVAVSPFFEQSFSKEKEKDNDFEYFKLKCHTKQVYRKSISMLIFLNFVLYSGSVLADLRFGFGVGNRRPGYLLLHTFN